MAVEVRSLSQQSITPAHPVVDVRSTDCCIVGGGPAGVVLALLLARQGIDVTLLEAHTDFDRDFRGDTIHPSTMELMDELGLSERLLQLPHTKISHVTVQTAAGPITPIDFRRLKTRYPYITFMPQARFLEFVTAEAQRYPNFRLLMGARVEELIEEDGVVRGVRYRQADDWYELRALLTVGADGRFSRLRHLAGFEPLKTSPPMDVLWFRIPRKPDDPAGATARIGRGHILALLDRGAQWQVAYVIPKGSYKQLKAAGIEALRQSITKLAPEYADQVTSLRDWKQCSLLSVESDRLPRWYKPGLLLIGDAAHVMSPVGGVGINLAVQDAVVAANVLTQPLKAGHMRLSDLEAVQRQREWPTRIIQTIQMLIQRLAVSNVLRMQDSFTPPRWLRLAVRVPFLPALPARIMGLGVWRVQVKRKA